MVASDLTDEVVEKVASCREAVVLATHRLFDDIASAVKDTSSTLNALAQRSIQDGTVDIEIVTLNKFVRFICDELDVRHVDGLVALAQAFVWNDRDMVSNFIQQANNIVVYAKEASTAASAAVLQDRIVATKPTDHVPALDPTPPNVRPPVAIIAPSPSSGPVVFKVRDIPSKKRGLPDIVRPDVKNVDATTSMDVPPFAKKNRAMVAGRCQPVESPMKARASPQLTRRSSLRVLPDNEAMLTVGTMPKSKREAIDRIVDRGGDNTDVEWLSAKAMELYSIKVDPDYVRRILARRAVKA
ncbi:hypothetical protein H310_05135 [Aphanomyces invadans]|uniref:Uncharacterized protein n=1 Tax=Aphanomyces invadans TaxID=157072 RepID=A0A024UBW8_9STRA|nr:hypothetical protein H310_05135 [Aphanomyces invadans]ETW03769.1 hypothetical protein H310_05135 [Aphanomyces invadans]|eukprot:XP_008867998.1 hypothetical protein H310_05135 [Aphanomyces invadans]